MAIKYYKLLDLINRRGISKMQLKEMTGIGNSTLAKLSSNENVALDVIERICEVLGVQPGDIMEYYKDNDELND